MVVKGDQVRTWLTAETEHGAIESEADLIARAPVPSRSKLLLNLFQKMSGFSYTR